MVSRTAGLPSPIDGVTVALDDDDQLVRDVRNARAFGFGGKLCVHPKQVAFVNHLLAPDEKEITWAKAIIAAVEAAGENVIQFEGKMVDRPVVERRRRSFNRFFAEDCTQRAFSFDRPTDTCIFPTLVTDSPIVEVLPGGQSARIK